MAAPSLVTTSSRTLGAFEVGPIGFGCWRFTHDGVDEARALLERALDLGMNLIDTADVYGLDWGGTGFGANEEVLGTVLAQAPELRERMVLATKGGIMPPTPYNSSDEYLTKACDDSLRRLGVDVIDLYQIHRPDVFTHPEALAATLTKLREAGKIREVGVSNYTPAQTDTLQSFCDFRIVSDQPQFSLVHLDPMSDGTFDRCLRERTVPLAWSPLGGGSLATGDGLRPELLAELDRLAAREGVTRSVVALAFVLAHPAAAVALVGTQKLDRLDEMASALTVGLDRDDVYALIPAATGVPLP
ncbi:MAG: aldo/keto reductase [Acidimicrobiales bacterium]